MSVLTPYIFLFALFGIAIGSFLNVILFRFRTGKGFGGRSKCLSCGKELAPMEMIPVMSFVFQRGRCRSCKAKLSWQYPLVELTASAIAVMVFFKHIPDLSSVVGFAKIALDFALWQLLLIVCVYDIRHKIIPDQWVIGLLFIGLLHAVLVFFSYIPAWGGNMLYPAMPLWSDLVSGPALALPLAALWLLSRGTWIGLGDAKLMLPLGWFFGIGQGLTIFVLSFWIGSVPSIILLLLPKKHFSMKTELPFAPFLVMATLVVYLTEANILNWSF